MGFDQIHTWKANGQQKFRSESDHSVDGLFLFEAISKRICRARLSTFN